MIADGLTLFCLVNGEASFSVEIEPTKTVDALKKLIKAEKSPEFDDIAANNLILWRVSIPFTEEEHPILLDSQDEKRKLVIPTARLHKLFPGELLDETIHIIVELLLQPKEFEVVIASDGGLVAEEIKFPWLVNAKTATLDELWTIVFQNWNFCSDYKQSDLRMVLKTGNPDQQPQHH
ncbi:hypothetical protein BGW38_007752 [Lunasporangiospora selenospora]|uniref:Crinkler effector protein N-terminal domain-containing protein n=1 Tax=Lunasporangiospora selenospora TaxID=979761 RepID=A0A9P6FKQ5_9FUNG|nr:hypothetical protein BGW38_007752 [Lunasporangiospora selenospora]